jgi:hypothetical protein
MIRLASTSVVAASATNLDKLDGPVAPTGQFPTCDRSGFFAPVDPFDRTAGRVTSQMLSSNGTTKLPVDERRTCSCKSKV